MKLDDGDRAVLSRLGSVPRSIPPLAEELGTTTSALSQRLDALADNGLVYRLDDGRVQRTESGRRVLRTKGGTADERIDTSPAVERTLKAFTLTPEEAEAVRGSFVFLRYWGSATADEIIDAVYSEDPAGYETGDAWWSECVREPLAALPKVVQPARPGESWRYAGRPEVATPLSSGFAPVKWRGRQSTASVKQAIESLGLSAGEKDAIRAAFSHLRQHGAATESELKRTVYPQQSGGYDSPGAWWTTCVRPAFERLPGVSLSGETWRYDSSTRE